MPLPVHRPCRCSLQRCTPPPPVSYRTSCATWLEAHSLPFELTVSYSSSGRLSQFTPDGGDLYNQPPGSNFPSPPLQYWSTRQDPDQTNAHQTKHVQVVLALSIGSTTLASSGTGGKLGGPYIQNRGQLRKLCRAGRPAGFATMYAWSISPSGLASSYEWFDYHFRLLRIGGYSDRVRGAGVASACL